MSTTNGRPCNCRDGEGCYATTGMSPGYIHSFTIETPQTVGISPDGLAIETHLNPDVGAHLQDSNFKELSPDEEKRFYDHVRRPINKSDTRRG